MPILFAVVSHLDVDIISTRNFIYLISWSSSVMILSCGNIVNVLCHHSALHIRLPTLQQLGLSHSKASVRKRTSESSQAISTIDLHEGVTFS